jgi:AcrR family transcriptional regulator
MQDLGEALGMNRGSLYHYINGKDELLWAILNRALDVLEARVVPVLEADAPAAERLRAAIREHLRVAAENADELSLIQIELRALNPDQQRAIVDRRNAYENRWRATLDAGIAEGSLRPFDVRLAGIGILSACNWFTQWYRPDGRLAVDEIADAFAELFLGGLRA